MPTNNIPLTYLVSNQNSAEILINEDLDTIDGFMQLKVKMRTLSAPPGSPVNGDRYLVAATGSGLWLGQTGKIALWSNTAWKFFTPQEGWVMWVDDENRLFVYDGTVWDQLSRKTFTRHRVSFRILNPDSGAGSYRIFFWTSEAITIKSVNVIVRGGTPSTSWQLRHSTDASVAEGTGSGGTKITGATTTSETTGDTIVASWDDNTIPANSFIWSLQTAVTDTGAITYTIEYTIDQT